MAPAKFHVTLVCQAQHSPYSPDVHILAIVGAAQQQLRGAVPARADVVGYTDLSRVGRQLAGKAKVAQFQLANS